MNAVMPEALAARNGIVSVKLLKNVTPPRSPRLIRKKNIHKKAKNAINARTLNVPTDVVGYNATFMRALYH